MKRIKVQRIFGYGADEAWKERCQEAGLDPRGVFVAIPTSESGTIYSIEGMRWTTAHYYYVRTFRELGPVTIDKPLESYG